MSAYYCHGCDRMRDADRHGFNDEGCPEGDARCDECTDADHERAVERQHADFYGGDTPTLREQQAEARRLK